MKHPALSSSVMGSLTDPIEKLLLCHSDTCLRGPLLRVSFGARPWGETGQLSGAFFSTEAISH